ncbi:MAG: alanine racemase [Gammaproteobacteria bacterium]|nr:alanine racemase [Gammaproteobacteria bacterium]
MANSLTSATPVHATIALAALRHNLALLQAAAPGSKMLAVIKANAYGHGAVQAARALELAAAFGVARLGEGLELRERGITKPIVLMEGVFTDEELELALDNELDFVVHADYQVDLLERRVSAHSLKKSRPARVVWLELDTGMSRLGFQTGQAAAAAARVRANGLVGELRVMTHFARADEPAASMTTEQLQRFDAELFGLSAPATGVANSAAILSATVGQHEWVRAGIALYGGSPVIGRTADSLGLKPVMTLSTRVIALRSINTGDSVGYGASWRAARPSRIATLAAGYADGVPRHLPSGAPVLVAGRRVPIVGRVSMDMITVDVTDVPKVSVGTPVVLWGDGLSVDDVATAAGTISYELLCGVTHRVAFDYV